MKKITALFGALMIIAAATVSCGEKNEVKTSESSSKGTSETVSEADTSSADIDVQEQEIKTAPSEVSIPKMGMEITLPGDFVDERSFYLSTYSKKTDKGDTIYFLCYSYPGYSQDFSDNEFTESNVPDILKSYIVSDIDKFYPTYEDKFTMSTSDEESLTIKDNAFILRNGIIHTEKVNDPVELNYRGYFGVIPVKSRNIEKEPACWLAFTASNDPDTLNEMNAIADSVKDTVKFE